MKNVNNPSTPKQKEETPEERARREKDEIEMEKAANLKNRRNALANLADSLEQDGRMKFYEACFTFSNDIEKACKESGMNARLYKAFHVLILSTVEDYKKHPFYDFPELENSVEEFYNRMEKDYAEKAEKLKIPPAITRGIKS